MQEPGLTLEEISDATGVERRTLRSWISEGLLAPPFKSGRGARYPDANVERALAVRALQQVHGKQLAEIRKELMLADEARIRAWAAEARQPSLPITSARDYLRSLDSALGRKTDPKAKVMFHQSARYVPPRDPPQAAWSGIGKKAADWTRTASEDAGEDELWRRKKASVARDLGGIEALIVVLEAAVRVSPSRRSRGSEWLRIPITPDLELMVRGAMAPPDRATLERVADLMRAILTGGLHDDQI